MAKRLTTQDKIKRLRSQGFSRKELAQSFGVSVSAIGRAERGQTSGDTIKAQVDQFSKLGKRAKSSVVSGSASLPSAKTPRPAKPRKAKEAPPAPELKPYEIALAKAEGYLSGLDGDEMVVVGLTFLDGTTRWFFTRGGIEASEIRGNLRDAIDRQADRQGRGNQKSISDPLIDWNDVVDIKIEEY